MAEEDCNCDWNFLCKSESMKKQNKNNDTKDILQIMKWSADETN